MIDFFVEIRMRSLIVDVLKAPVGPVPPCGVPVPGSIFKRAKTVEEVEKRLGIRVSVESGVKKPDIMNTLNDILEEYERMLRANPKFRGVELFELKLSAFHLNLNNASMGLYEGLTKTITVQPTAGHKIARAAQLKLNAAKVKATTFRDAKNVFRHEFGHGVQHQLITEAENFRLRDAFFDIVDDPKKLKILKTKISSYATTDPDEAFAEIFNLMVRGDPVSDDVYPTAVKLIRRILGKVKKS